MSDAAEATSDALYPEKMLVVHSAWSMDIPTRLMRC
jgi:hypothetical protein